MKDLNKNRKGYKHTPVGWIPEDWGIVKIRDFAKSIAGGTPSTTKAEYWGGQVKWMSSGDLNMKKVNDVEGRITELGLKNSSTRLIPPKCVLIGLAGQGKTRGTVAMNMVELCTNQSVAAILPNEKYVPEYLYYNLDLRYQELRRLSTGDGGRGGLNLNIIDSIFIPFPIKDEQSLIAKTLSIWDNAIESIENLIYAKEQLKKGLMQQLLTGKNRLPGFNGEWKEIDFGKVFDFIRTESFSRDDLTYSVNEGKVAYIHYGDIHAKFENQVLNASNETLPYLKISELSNKAFSYLLDGDLVIADASEDYDGVAECIELSNINGKQIIGGLHTIVARDKSSLTVPGFRAYIFKNPVISLRLKKVAVGTSVYSVSKSELSKLKIPLPTIEEQTIIARIFSDIDKEINILKSELELYRQQKKGLMQVLLTGAVRVKI